MGNYGIVDWYIEKKGVDFDKWKSDKDRNNVIETNAEGFFKEIMKYARDNAPTAEKASSMAILKNNTSFKNESIRKIKDDGYFITAANDIFNNSLKPIVQNSSLPEETKAEAIREIPRYDSQIEFSNYILEKEKNYRIIKAQIENADKEIQEAEEQILDAEASLEQIKRVETEAKTSEEFIQARKLREAKFKRSASQTKRRELESAGRFFNL